MNGRKFGFTLIEIIVVVAIFATLVSISYVRATSIQRRAPLTATVDTLIADLRGQQTKAMTGDAQSGIQSDTYGIYFQSNAYILFKGTYSSSNPANAVNPLPENIIVSTVTFPGSNITFDKGSGDVVGYSSGTNTITLTQSLTGEQKTITLDRYGAITQIQ